MTCPAVVRITVPGGPAVVRVVTQGPPGPQGPQGPQGEAANPFVFTQSTPSTTWTINHGLGYRPSVELFDSGSQEIDGEVSHPTVNQTIVSLNPATAGTARLI